MLRKTFHFLSASKYTNNIHFYFIIMPILRSMIGAYKSHMKCHECTLTTLYSKAIYACRHSSFFNDVFLKHCNILKYKMSISYFCFKEMMLELIENMTHCNWNIHFWIQKKVKKLLHGYRWKKNNSCYCSPYDYLCIIAHKNEL